MEHVGSGMREIKYSEAVEAFLTPSITTAAGLVLAAAATLAVMAFTPIGAFARLAVLALVLLATRDAVRVVALRRTRRGVRAFRIERSRAIRVWDATGRARDGLVCDGSFVAPWLTIVRWRPAGGRFDRTFVVVPGMLEDEAFRRLRVLLRWD